MSWNPFSRLSSGSSRRSVITRTAERDFEKEVKKLEEHVDVSRRLYKDAKRWVDANQALVRSERRIAADLLGTSLCQSNEELRHNVEEWDKALQRLEACMQELNSTVQKTVIDPLKRYNSIFPHIQAAVKKREQSLQELQKCQSKVSKYQERERTGQNVVKLDQSKKTLEAAREEFTAQNSGLVEDLPKFYDSRTEYFQPCLEALINAQMTYSTEAFKQYSEQASQLNQMKTLSNEEYSARIQQMLNDIKSLSITID